MATDIGRTLIRLLTNPDAAVAELQLDDEDVNMLEVAMTNLSQQNVAPSGFEVLAAQTGASPTAGALEPGGSAAARGVVPSPPGTPGGAPSPAVSGGTPTPAGNLGDILAAVQAATQVTPQTAPSPVAPRPGNYAPNESIGQLLALLQQGGQQHIPSFGKMIAG